MFLGLRFVVYNVDDLEKAGKWYEKAFNTAPNVEKSDYMGFSIGSDRLGLRLVEKFDLKMSSSPIAYWSVSDIHAEYKRLLENGALEQGGMKDMGGGIVAATVLDPFGNTLGLIGYNRVPNNEAIEAKPSKTALWTTHMRAFAAKEPHEEIRGPDYLAEIFLEKAKREALGDANNRGRQKADYFVTGVYEYVMARTRIFDGFFKQSLEKGVEQVVFLGAGYDSRPYRFQDLIQSVPVFELDVAPTQKHKITCLKAAGVKIPPQVTYAPINFNTQSIREALHETGFDTSKKTLFMWEGVTYYLAPDAVDATLDFIRSYSPSGSMVAFDYIALWPGIFEAYGVKELIEFNAANQSGESGNNFAIEEGAIDSFLSKRGFQVSVHLNSSEIEKEFLTFKDGALFGHVTGSFRIVKAVTK